jgi:RHS repeat-associated protein
VTDPSNQTFGVGYDAGGRLGTLTRPNGVDDTFSYTPSGDLTGIVSTLGGTQVASTGYGIDPVTGRVNTRTDQTGTTGFGYEPDGVLASVAPPAGSTQPAEAYTSDNFANRLTGPTASDVSHYSAGSRLTTDGTYTYTYDGEGNLKSRTVIATGKVTGYGWNADHQLTTVHLPDGGVVSYAYDPLGRRISAVGPSGTTRYVWDHWNVTATYNATNTVTASMVTLPTAVSGTTPGQPVQVIEETHGTTHIYPLHDGLGSVTALTDQTGAVTDTLTYSAYGTPTGTTPNTDISTYTGYQHDPDTGLYYANHRYYDPTTGRFLSEDPVTANSYNPPTGIHIFSPRFPNQAGSAVTQNPNAYAASDPTNVLDATGLDISGEAILLGGALGAVSGGLIGAAGAAETCHGDQSCIVGAVVANIGIGTLEGAAVAAIPAFGGKRLLGCLIGGLAGSISGVGYDALTGGDISSWNEVGSAATAFAIGCAYGAVGGTYEP